MSKRKMFLRMITASLLRRRSRMLIALLSIAIGATILSGLVTIYYDVPRQMGAQFRSYGANMILVAKEGESLTTDTLQDALGAIPEDQLVGATPYRYVRLDMTSRQQSFTTAGTDFTEVQKTSPYFSVEGEYPQAENEILLGKEIADTIGAKVGSYVQLTWRPVVTAHENASDDWVPNARLSGSAEGFNAGIVVVEATLDEEGKIASLDIDASSQTPEIGGQVETDRNFISRFIGQTLPVSLGEDVDAVSGATISSQAVVDALNNARSTEKGSAAAERSGYFNVTGILVTGGEEESYIYMNLEDLEGLTNDKLLDVAELSVSANAEQLEEYVKAIDGSDAGITARLVKRVTRSETAVLGKLQALVFLVTVVVLLLTMICVSTTMMAAVSERRREIGLRKALGAPDNSIRAEFLGEGMFLGGLGGLLGGLLGFVFAQVVSVNVFGSSITFQPLLLPITLLVSTLIAALSCLLPIKRAVAIDPALVLKGE
ncbi:MAG: FMN-binding protein [Oscillospiraceae bacterium]|nr:FMN-binding protein [Oscillospiraceae bacterium]